MASQCKYTTIIISQLKAQANPPPPQKKPEKKGGKQFKPFVFAVPFPIPPMSVCSVLVSSGYLVLGAGDGTDRLSIENACTEEVMDNPVVVHDSLEL